MQFIIGLWLSFMSFEFTMFIPLQMRIVDEEGNILPVGKEGRVEVKSPGIFSGYKDMPEATKEAFTQDSFFKTK